MTTYDQLREESEKYIQMGWFIVPVKNKVTSTSFESLMTDGVYDPNKFFEILEHGKDYFTGIGVITGEKSNLTVVDLDIYKGIDENVKSFFGKFTNTPVSISGRGGYHLFFRYSPFMPNRAEVLKGVDVKNQNGMIVLPPSTHENGNKYTWHISPESVQIQEVTPELLRVLNGEKLETNVKEHFDFNGFYQMGERDDSITRACASLATTMKSKETMLTFMKSWVKDHVENWKDFEENNWKSLNVKIESAYRKFSEKIETKEKITVFEGSDLHTSSGDSLRDILEKRRKEIGDGISTTYEDLDRYFTFKRGRLYLLSASTHMGKSAVSLLIAMRISLTHKVLFAGLENGLDMLEGKDIRGNNFHFTWADGMVTADKLRETIEQIKPEIVFVDHIHFLARSGKGATEDMDKNIMEMQMLAQRCDIPVFVNAHLRKTDGRVPTLDDLKDSSSLSQVPSVVMFLHREQNKDVSGEFLSREGKIIIAKNRLGSTEAGLRYTFERGEIIFNKPRFTKLFTKKEPVVQTPPVFTGGMLDSLDGGL